MEKQQSDISQEEAKLVKEWVRNFRNSENFCRRYFEKGEENYRLYKSYIEQSNKVYTHNIFVPYAFAYLEDMTAYFMLSILASPQIFNYSARWQGISEELAREINIVCNWALQDPDAEFVLELENLFKNIGIYNVGYMINYPLQREALKRSALIPEETYSSLDFDKLHFDSPCTLDVFPEPGPKRLSRSNWIIKKSIVNYTDLLNDPDYKQDRLIGIPKNSGEKDAVSRMLQDIGYTVDKTHIGVDEKGTVVVLDCMTDNNVITVAGYSRVIRDTREEGVSPYAYKFPILDCRTTGAPNEFFGHALLESIKPTQKELNLLRSQRRDNISLILNKVWVYDTLAGQIDLDSLFSAPGNVVVTAGRGALDELDTQDVTQSSFEESRELQYDLQNISSLWDYARGGTPRRRETATGIIRLQQAAQARNEWILRKVDQLVLQPLARRIPVYLRDTMDRHLWGEIIGPENRAGEFFDMDPNYLKKALHIMPLTESIVSIREVDLNQFLQAFDRLSQMPPDVINHTALAKELLLKTKNKNIKEILTQLSPAAQQGLMQGMQGMQQRRPLPGMEGQQMPVNVPTGV